MQYNLVFSTDINYLPYLFVVCQSIINNIELRESNEQDELIFNVIVDKSVDLPQANADAQSFIERNQTSTIKHSFVWHVIDGDRFKNFKAQFRDNKASFSTYYRFVIDTLLPEDVSIAAYLDVDMLVYTDIRRLFDENDISSMVLGAVIDPGVFNFDLDTASIPVVRLKSKITPSEMIEIPRKTYFNAGMLLINLIEWRKHNIREKCFDAVSNYDVLLHDQDVLNIVCQGKVKLINLAWNLQTLMFFALYNTESEKYDILSALTPEFTWKSETPSPIEFERAFVYPNIVHFTGIKPWQSTTRTDLLCAMPQPTPPKIKLHLQKWREIFYSMNPKVGLNNCNVDAISETTLAIYKQQDSIDKLYAKTNRVRKLSQWGLLVLLVLNLFTLALLLIK